MALSGLHVFFVFHPELQSLNLGHAVPLPPSLALLGSGLGHQDLTSRTMVLFLFPCVLLMPSVSMVGTWAFCLIFGRLLRSGPFL